MPIPLLLVWLSWLEHPPISQKATGSIPNQGTYPDCGFNPIRAHVRKWLIDVSLSLKAMKKYPWVRIKKKAVNSISLLRPSLGYQHALLS